MRAGQCRQTSRPSFASYLFFFSVRTFCLTQLECKLLETWSMSIFDAKKKFNARAYRISRRSTPPPHFCYLLGRHFDSSQSLFYLFRYVWILSIRFSLRKKVLGNGGSKKNKMHFQWNEVMRSINSSYDKSIATIWSNRILLAFFLVVWFFSSSPTRNNIEIPFRRQTLISGRLRV